MNTSAKLIFTDMGLIPVITQWGLTPFLMIVTGCAAVALVIHFVRNQREGIF